MRKMILILSAFVFTVTGSAAVISGTITDKTGAILPFASILIKGTTQGVSANSNGFYSIALDAGEHTLVCQYTGHQSVEKKIRAGRGDITLDFQLEEQQYNLNSVTVRSGAEDPAYAIIRKAIEKREEHLNEIKKFQCNVYIKGQLQLRNYPKNFLGQKVDFEDGDTSKRKMLFLSETVARYSVEEPGNRKVEVLSTKVSGRSDGYGFGNPQFISFYENTLSMGRGLNPRGFISPISNNALNYYRYKFEGTFFENGREISRIKVMPKRTYEPLFTGYINIVENEWRIQSVDLKLLKEQQMQLLDTLVVQQLYVPAGNVWVIKNQVIYPSGKFFAFEFFGNFVQVYDQFDLAPSFEKKFFNSTVLKYFDSSNKKPMAYWDSIRPLPLLAEEKRDYVKKDSLEQVRKDPRYLDSLDKKNNKLRLSGILFTGQSFSRQKRKESISFDPLIRSLNYNTVEGAVLSFSPNYNKQFAAGRQSLSLRPYVRYGFANGHFNAHLTGNYNFGKKYLQAISFSGGKRVFQYNNDNPIAERLNTLSTLLYEANHMKIYEAEFFKLGYSTGLGGGLTIYGNFQYQNRHYLPNLADPVSWANIQYRTFTQNYPFQNGFYIPDTKASAATVGFTWRPGGKYIEFPDRKISLGSKYPTLTASVTKGIKGLLASDVDYTKWHVNVTDNFNMKLGGRFSYRIAADGFFDATRVYVQDLIQYMGNQTVISSEHLASFQLAPYYKYSNSATFNLSAHAEYHLNGLLTNKIPGFKKLNWFFVLGGNAMHIKGVTDYYEASFGIENIFKVLRVDFVQGWEKGGNRPNGLRISLPFVFGRSAD